MVHFGFAGNCAKNTGIGCFRYLSLISNIEIQKATLVGH